MNKPTSPSFFADHRTAMLAIAVKALLAAPGPFEVEEGNEAGRLILTTKGGSRAEVDIRSVVWGTDGPAL